MAHHGSTPTTVLNAPEPTPLVVWDPHDRVKTASRNRRPSWKALGAFRGSVAALIGDPRAAQLAGRRKARAKANRAAKREAAALGGELIMDSRAPFGAIYPRGA